ncbi:unnamed protein product, partial [marine sediment metagenome]
ITISCTKCQYDRMRRDADSYVYKDHGAGYFGNFSVDFEFQVTATDGAALHAQFAISNLVGTFQDMIDGNDGLLFFAYGNNGNLRLSIRDYNTDTTDDYFYGGTSTILLYVTIYRSGTTLTADIYMDSGRTSLLDSMSLTCETGSKRYMYALTSRGLPPVDGAEQSGYTQNFEIQFNSSSSSSTSFSSSSSSLSSSSNSSSSISSSSNSTSSSSTSCYVTPDDNFTGTNGDPPNVHKWDQIIQTGSYEGSILSNRFNFDPPSS